jgi:hypothetical protein
LNFTDVQVLTLIRANPGLNVYQLAKKAKEEMGMGGQCSWTTGKVQKAVERLKKERKVKTQYIVRRQRTCQLVYATV